MADWSKPVITSNYVTFVDEVKNRDIDAITLTRTAITNPPIGSVKLLRTPIAFQEWTGAAYGTLVLSIDGGGTGGYNAPMARNNLGLGTMSLQNAEYVTITGGVVQSVIMQGNTQVNGAFYFNPPPATVAMTVSPVVDRYGISIQGPNAVNQSYGLIIRAGTTRSDAAVVIENATATTGALYITGDMVTICPNRLVIPVGANRWA